MCILCLLFTPITCVHEVAIVQCINLAFGSHLYILKLLFVYLNGNNYKTKFSDTCKWKYGNIFCDTKCICFCWLFSCGHQLLMLASFWQHKFMESAGIFVDHIFLVILSNMKDCSLSFWGQ
jgi:hypothetical protein